MLGELGSIGNVVRIDTLNKIYYLISYDESLNEYKSKPMIGLYNYSEKNGFMNIKLITNLEKTGLGLVSIQNNKIYHDGASHVFCNDLWTGDSIWTPEFKGIFCLEVVLMTKVLSTAPPRQLIRFRCGDRSDQVEGNVRRAQAVEWWYWMEYCITSMEATDDYGLWMQLQERTLWRLKKSRRL